MYAQGGKARFEKCGRSCGLDERKIVCWLAERGMSAEGAAEEEERRFDGGTHHCLYDHAGSST